MMAEYPTLLLDWLRQHPQWIMAAIILALGCLYGLQRWLHPVQSRHLQLTQLLRLEPFRSPRTTELPLGAALTLLTSISLFSLLAVGVALGNPLTPIDQALTAAFQHLRSAPLDRWITALTLLGDGWHLVWLSLALGISLLRQHHLAAACLWLGAVAALLLLNVLLKLGLSTPRPEILLQPLGSFSFPSGHSSAATLFFMLLAAFIAQQQPGPKRWLTYSLAVLPAGAIGLSRIYLGVHWFSDVLGGMLLGLAIAAATLLVYSRFDRQPLRINRPGLWLTGLLISSLYIALRLDDAVLRYLPSTL